jgi:flagellin
VSVKIGSNTTALRAQRSFAQSSNELSSVFERLASGQRINRASDDAAGLAIADRLRADRILRTQSIANINDGISAITIADSSLEQRGGILQRLSELAEQSANGTFSSTQRGSLGTEYSELLRELARIRESTSFNGLDLFDYNNPLNLQVGIRGDAGSRIGLDGTNLGTSEWTIDPADLFYVGDWNKDSSVDGDDLIDAYAFFDSNGVTIDELKSKFGGNWTTTSVVDSNGVTRDVFIGAASDQNGIVFLSFTASADGSRYYGNYSGTKIFSDAHDAGQLAPGTNLPTSPITVSDGLGTAAWLAAGGIGNPIPSRDTSGSFTIDYRILRLGESGAGGSRPSSLYMSGVESIARSRSSLDILRDELSMLSAHRGKIGATQSRLQTALSLSQVAKENVAQAEGRIRDADTAQEAARLVRLQILQQVGATVLQNASTQPQIALQLLRG